MIDVALALKYLHHGYSIPIVHCDLNPSNVLLDEDMVGHVVDFCIARLFSGGNAMTQTMMLAPIRYMAPGIVSIIYAYPHVNCISIYSHISIYTSEAK